MDGWIGSGIFRFTYRRGKKIKVQVDELYSWFGAVRRCVLVSSRGTGKLGARMVHIRSCLAGVVPILFLFRFLMSFSFPFGLLWLGSSSIPTISRRKVAIEDEAAWRVAAFNW
jgi:hypothetical protein